MSDDDPTPPLRSLRQGDKLTPHFSVAELACHSGEPTPPEVITVQYDLCSQLEELRMEWGTPLVVICGWRSPAYNAAIYRASEARAQATGRAHGGVSQNSQHLTGAAVDIRPIIMSSLLPFRNLIDRMLAKGQLPRIGGVGWYPEKWVHLDLRPRMTFGKLTRWEGQGVGSEVTV